jgi:hypothetical protein
MHGVAGPWLPSTLGMAAQDRDLLGARGVPDAGGVVMTERAIPDAVTLRDPSGSAWRKLGPKRNRRTARMLRGVNPKLEGQSGLE